MEHEIKVVEWIADDEVANRETAIGGLGGWFGINREQKDEKGLWEKSGDRWKDFIEAVRPELVPYYEALRTEVVANKIKMGGDSHQNSSAGVPLFSDGKVGQFSYRAWGDFMAAVWSEEENYDYTYMDFYMDVTMKDNETN